MEEQILNAKLSENKTYLGEVHCQIENNTTKEIVYDYKSHNAGHQNLFKFFASALSGNWGMASSLAPCQIQLFEFNEPTHPTEEELKDLWTIKNSTSPLVHYDTAIVSEPYEETYTDETGKHTIQNGYKSTFHFRIPFLYISGNVNHIGLYPQIVSSLYDDLSASFKFNELIEVPAEANNFTIIINWTLIIKNPSTIDKA